MTGSLIIFESLSHTNTILHGLSELRRHGQLLDVTLMAEGKSFKVSIPKCTEINLCIPSQISQAHRAVLASCSDYFRAMFTDAMRESRQNEICLNGVTAQGIELLLNYAYTSKLELNLANVQDVLSAASHVQMDAVVDACTNYLQSQLDNENCVDLITISETYSLEKLRQKCYRFICAHLYEFSIKNEINRLARHQLEHILSCDFPVDCTEETVLRIVLQWIDSQRADIKIAHRLLHNVRLSEIPTTELEQILIDCLFARDSQIYISTISLATSQRRLQRMQKNTATFPTTNNNELTNYRGMELALINVGGFRLAGITNEITYYLPTIKKWHHLTSIPHVEQCNYGTAVLGNELYVVGGCYNVCLREYIHPFGFRYNPMTNKWTTIAPMRMDRCRFSLNFVGNYLYAIGGVSEVDDAADGDMIYQELSETNNERYDPDTDSWESIAMLAEHRTQHAGASDANFLYISGGLDRQRVLESFWRYDPANDQWEQLPNMLNPRADHVMLTIDNNLYVCGGWFEETHGDSRRLIESIDRFDLNTRQWASITAIPTPKYHAGIVAVETKIYIIGGFYSDSMFDRASSTIECYDIVKNEWTNLDRYPQNTWESTCVSLYIPKFRDDMEVMMDENGNDEEAS